MFFCTGDVDLFFLLLLDILLRVRVRVYGNVIKSTCLGTGTGWFWKTSTGTWRVRIEIEILVRRRKRVRNDFQKRVRERNRYGLILKKVYGDGIRTRTRTPGYGIPQNCLESFRTCFKFWCQIWGVAQNFQNYHRKVTFFIFKFAFWTDKHTENESSKRYSNYQLFPFMVHNRFPPWSVMD